MAKKSVGRPRKKFAVQSGQLQIGLQRFTFIIDRNLLNEVKIEAMRLNLSIKDFMDQLITAGLNNNDAAEMAAPVGQNKPQIKERIKPVRIVPQNKNEAKLLASFGKHIVVIAI